MVWLRPLGLFWGLFWDLLMTAVRRLPSRGFIRTVPVLPSEANSEGTVREAKRRYAC